MTVKQLIEQLSKYPDNMDVFMAERKTEFAYGLLNSVRSDEIIFVEEPDSLSNTEGKMDWEVIEEPPKVECVILDEE